jgi:Zn-dependent M28 family amino/carboxypeptidase
VLAGLLLVSVLAWFVVTHPLLTTPELVPSPHVDPMRLEAHVRVLAEHLIPRDWKHPENLDRAADYIRQEFVTGGGRVREQAYAMNGKTYRNVIADFGPETSHVIVVGAHYDAAGEFPGADDNASGVAGVIELAHLLGKVPLRSRVELVAFTLEEPATMDGPGFFRESYGGSAVHAASLQQQGADVGLALNLEMIGFFSDREGSQRYPMRLLELFYPDQGNFVTVVGKFGQGHAVRSVKAAMRAASPLPVHSMSAPEFVEGVDWSDHANYWKAGYNAVMVTDTAFYRNPNYHTIRDTSETLDYARMARVVAGVLAAVQAIAIED